MTDLASIAAATAVKWQILTTDKGAGASPRYWCWLSKPTIGQPGASGGRLQAAYAANTSMAAAQTGCLAALNKQRVHVYGGQDATAGKSTLPTAGLGDPRTHTSRTFDE